MFFPFQSFTYTTAAHGTRINTVTQYHLTTRCPLGPSSDLHCRLRCRKDCICSTYQTTEPNDESHKSPPSMFVGHLHFLELLPDPRFLINSRSALFRNTEVLSHICTLIKPSTILLGHSLESYIHSQKLPPSHCIDKAQIFHHPCGRPSSLDWHGFCASGSGSLYRMT